MANSDFDKLKFGGLIHNETEADYRITPYRKQLCEKWLDMYVDASPLLQSPLSAPNRSMLPKPEITPGNVHYNTTPPPPQQQQEMNVHHKSQHNFSFWKKFDDDFENIPSSSSTHRKVSFITPKLPPVANKTAENTLNKDVAFKKQKNDIFNFGLSDSVKKTIENERKVKQYLFLKSSTVNNSESQFLDSKIEKIPKKKDLQMEQKKLHVMHRKREHTKKPQPKPKSQKLAVKIKEAIQNDGLAHVERNQVIKLPDRTCTAIFNIKCSNLIIGKECFER